MIKEILQHFNIDGNMVDYKPFGSGHINDTYMVTYQNSQSINKVTLQKINTSIFTNPEKLMDNLLNVTNHIKKKLLQQGLDTKRGTINIILTNDKKPYYKDVDGNYWRAYHFIENATSFDKAETVQDFYESAVAFGNFQQMLSDFPANTLHETLPDFHNTQKRYLDFCKAIKQDKFNRVKDCIEEIEYIQDHEQDMSIITSRIKTGHLPLRVTHNDTKLNNILIDNKTKKAICIIDLDTVMPGSSLYDYGDSIRFGANTASEDEKNLSKVDIDLKLFEAYTKGFVIGCNGSLTEQEISLMPYGAKIITLECAMRFLTDFINGDTYFKTDYPLHNLVRCRTQLALVTAMEIKWEQMNKIVLKYK